MGCSTWLAHHGITLLITILVTLAGTGIGLPTTAWATPCLVPTTVNGVLAPIVAGSDGLSIPDNDNTVSTNGTSYSKITKGSGGSLDAGNASVQSSTVSLPLFSPGTFPGTGMTNISLSSGASLSAGAYNTVTLSKSGSYTFGAGNYYINALKINSNTTTLTLGSGDYFVRYFDAGQGQNDVTIRTNGVVRLFVGSGLAVHDAFDFNSAGATASLQIYLYAGATAFFHDKGIFNGLIYAPSAASCSDKDTSNNCIYFHDNSTIKGAILSGSTVFVHKSNDINFSSTVRSAIGGIAIPGCIAGSDHYELSLPSNGTSCLASTVSVTACATTTAPCTSAYTQANGQTLTLETSAGTLGATTLSFDAAGKATTTLSYPAAGNDATATVKLKDITGTVKCCQNGSCADSATASCTETFKTARLIFSATATGDATPLPDVRATCATSPTNTTYYLRAVQSGSTTGACINAPTGSTLSKKVRLGYQCNNPTTCDTGSAMGVSGASIASNTNGATANTTEQTLNFDANGSAKVSFDYFNDAGKVTLFATLPADNALLTTLSAETSFVVAPYNFALTDIPAAPLVAGDPFKVSVSAQNACNTATPNFGKETNAATATLTSSNPMPAMGNTTAISTALSGFNGGVASTNPIWQEVGTLDLTATTTAYLGSALNVSGTKAAVGRFKPAYFDVAPIVPACGTSYTYSGQPIRSVTITARERGGKTTGNYGGTAWAKAVTLSDTAGSTEHLTNNTVPANDFSVGVAIAKPTYAFADKLSAPANIGLRATDTDGVTSSGHTEATTDIRSGRLVLFSALGSNKLDLKMPLQTQYWSGKSWVINSDDSCTALPSGAFARSGDLAANTRVMSAVTFSRGNANITLSAPGNGKAGSVDVAVNLGSLGSDLSCLKAHGGASAAIPWLRSRNGDCATSYDRDPWARATFGIYTPETRRIVYVHDVF